MQLFNKSSLLATAQKAYKQQSKFSLLTVTLLFSSVTSAQNCDLQQAKKQFNKCIACHDVKEGVNKMGPSLHQVIDRKAGTQPGFYYSEAMKNSDITWTKENLSQFLKKPKDMVKGTTMPFSGIKKQAQRDAIICYLGQQ